MSLAFAIAASANFPVLLMSVTIGFVGIWLFSLLDSSARGAKDPASFIAQQMRSETGIGAVGASGH